MKKYNLDEVFGNSRDVPINYISRNNIDDTFIRSLNGEKHIVIYGSSKQGKTCLRKKHLQEESKYIFIQCSEKMSTTDINKLILKKAGIKIQVSEKKGKSGKKKKTAKFGIPIFGFKAGVEKETDSTISSEVETKYVAIDTSDTNDIIEVLKNHQFQKFIILDEFHVLKFKTQKEISIALKAYHENSKIVFIIIGVWLDSNKLIALNGNLAGRLVSINADQWEHEKLEEVIDAGAELLNIEFSKDLKEEIIEESFDNVYFVQEICNKVCEKLRIDATTSLDSDGKKFLVSRNFDVKEICKKAINQYSGRYEGFISHYSDGLKNTKLELHKWILFAILKSGISDLLDGLKTKKINKIIKEFHPKNAKLSLQKIRRTLSGSVYLQTMKEITPLVIDFDKSEDKLRIVDREFFIWLSYQDSETLIKSLELKLKD